jgi:RsiW-degrading membrane proteinase PrsW (M82 family)
MTTELREERGQPSSPPYHLLWWIIVLAGLVAALVLLLLGSLTLLLLLDGGFQAEMQIRQGIGMIGLGIGLIGVATGMGWRLAGSLPPAFFSPRRTWPLWLAFFAILIGGAVLSTLVSVPVVGLAVLSTLTMMLLPALVLGAMGRVMEGRGGTWEDVLGGLVAGASVGTGVAATIEVGVAVVVLLLFVGYSLLSGRPIDQMALMEQAQQPDLLTDPQLIANLMRPPILLLLLFGFSVVVPLVEETAKTLGVGLLGRWLRPHPARAFFLGIASGAGFALAENVLNVSLFEGSIWIGAVVSRVLATLMHCATGGMMGWGWGELWSARKPGHLALAYLGAVSVHGVWNGLAVMAALSGMALAGTRDSLEVLALSAVVGVSSLALLLLAAFCLIGMPWAGRVLARRAP